MNVSDKERGMVYAAEYILPQSTKQNLDNLNPGFSGHISGVKDGRTSNPQK